MMRRQDLDNILLLCVCGNKFIAFHSKRTTLIRESSDEKKLVVSVTVLFTKIKGTTTSLVSLQGFQSSSKIPFCARNYTVFYKERLSLLLFEFPFLFTLLLCWTEFLSTVQEFFAVSLCFGQFDRWGQTFGSLFKGKLLCKGLSQVIMHDRFFKKLALELLVSLTFSIFFVRRNKIVSRLSQTAWRLFLRKLVFPKRRRRWSMKDHLISKDIFIIRVFFSETECLFWKIDFVHNFITLSLTKHPLCQTTHMWSVQEPCSAFSMDVSEFQAKQEEQKVWKTRRLSCPKVSSPNCSEWQDKESSFINGKEIVFLEKPSSLLPTKVSLDE